MASLDMETWRRRQERLQKRQEERLKQRQVEQEKQQEQAVAVEEKKRSSGDENMQQQQQQQLHCTPPSPHDLMRKTSKEGRSILVRRNTGPSPQDSLSSLSNASPFQQTSSKRLLFGSQQSQEEQFQGENGLTNKSSVKKKPARTRRRIASLYDSDEEQLFDILPTTKAAFETKNSTLKTPKMANGTLNTTTETTTAKTDNQNTAPSPRKRRKRTTWTKTRQGATFMDDSDEDPDFDLFLKMQPRKIIVKERSHSFDDSDQEIQEYSPPAQASPPRDIWDSDDDAIDLQINHNSSSQKHNPIAMEKQQREMSMSRRASSPGNVQEQENRAAATDAVRHFAANDDDHLWSDSDQEQDETKPNKKLKSPPAASKKIRVSPAALKITTTTSSTRGAARSRERQVDKMTVHDASAPQPTKKPRKPKVFTGNNWDHFDPMDIEQDVVEDVALDALKPEFEHPKFEPSPLLPLVLAAAKQRQDGSGEDIAIPPVQVPAAMNRYLKEYQREGVEFMYRAVAKKQGCILGDDMGLGKTVQVIALLLALLRKEGTGQDMQKLNQRRRVMETKLRQQRAAADNALMFGRHVVDPSSTNVATDCELPPYCPVLIMVPPSVVQNWLNELSTWGHFGVCIYQGSMREAALERIQSGMDEIMVVGSGQFGKPNHFAALNEIPWKLVVMDEFHNYKNCKTSGHKRLQQLKSTHDPIMIGLSGTIMPNAHKELHSLVNLVQPGFLGDWGSFETHISKPIMLGRTKTAMPDTLERSHQRTMELQAKLKPVLLERKKKHVQEIKDELPMKDERVVFCELSPIQKQIYQHLMTLPDYVLLRNAKAPCECGVNQRLFMTYKRLKSDREKVAWQKTNQKQIVCKRDCCCHVPWNPRKNEEGQPLYDPRAALWKAYHPTGEPCDRCPYCLLLPSLHKLYKVCSHAALLQLDERPEMFGEKSKARQDAENKLKFAKVALTPDVLELMPGGSYIREAGIMDRHNELSGKMEVLDELLQACDKRGDRVLLFSYSTKTLGLLQNFASAKGYPFLRIDGTTPTSKRQGIVDEYTKDETIFLFLLSTKAAGLGLNMTAANVVIVFDVNWNPSLDEQAQDRSFRIGQKRDVTVIRLVSRGTIEELMYIRQVYKVHLKQETLGNGNEGVPQASRIFRGVAGDITRKGELFGSENLLKFKDGSFMEDIWKTSSKKKIGDVELHDTNALSDCVANMTEDEVVNIGTSELDPQFERIATGASSDEPGKLIEAIDGGIDRNQLVVEAKAISHEDFLRGDRGEAALQPGDDGFEEEMGGQSQVVYNVLEHAEINMEDAYELSVNEEKNDYERKHADPRLLLDTIAEEVDVLDQETQAIDTSPQPWDTRDSDSFPMPMPDYVASGAPRPVHVDSALPRPDQVSSGQVRATSLADTNVAVHGEEHGSTTRTDNALLGLPRPDHVASGVAPAVARMVTGTNVEMGSAIRGSSLSDMNGLRSFSHAQRPPKDNAQLTKKKAARVEANMEDSPSNRVDNSAEADGNPRQAPNQRTGAQKHLNCNIRLMGKTRKKMKQSKSKSRFTAADILG